MDAIRARPRGDRCLEGLLRTLGPVPRAGGLTRLDITLPMAEGDRIISLPTFSKWGDELAEATRDCERLILCGVATDCCVLSTVLGAVDAGKWVTVVTDACAGATDRAHEQALELMRLLSPMVTLATADELTAENGSED